MRLSFPLSLVLFLALVAGGQAESKYAVLRIPSHGGSGTVIATGEGWSLVLSCGHCFPGQDAYKPIAVDVPAPWGKEAPKKVGIKLLAVNHQDDLSLFKINYGPLPYVCPVAPLGHRPGQCLSVGFDEMEIPPRMRPADIIGARGNSTLTRQRPWHGRSGGALICKDSGFLVGVCSAYTGPKNRQEIYPGGEGVYVSHSAILRFLAKAGYGNLEGKGQGFPQEGAGPAPAPAPAPGGFAPSVPYRPPFIQEKRQFLPCPGGT